MLGRSTIKWCHGLRRRSSHNTVPGHDRSTIKWSVPRAGLPDMAHLAIYSPTSYLSSFLIPRWWKKNERKNCILSHRHIPRQPIVSASLLATSSQDVSRQNPTCTVRHIRIHVRYTIRSTASTGTAPPYAQLGIGLA